jgi:hypothetical protein
MRKMLHEQLREHVEIPLPLAAALIRIYGQLRG